MNKTNLIKSVSFSDSIRFFYYQIGGNLIDKFIIDFRYLQYMIYENRDKCYLNKIKHCLKSFVKYLKTFSIQSFKDFNFK